MRQHSLPHDVNHLCKRVSWLENFYEILYACQVEDVDIPFTVVYQYSQPYAATFQRTASCARSSPRRSMCQTR